MLQGLAGFAAQGLAGLCLPFALPFAIFLTGWAQGLAGFVAQGFFAMPEAPAENASAQPIRAVAPRDKVFWNEDFVMEVSVRR